MNGNNNKMVLEKKRRILFVCLAFEQKRANGGFASTIL
jgi:hypothetical protein